MDLLWLGYDNLSLPCAEIIAVLVYRPSLDRQLAWSQGEVPPGVRAVVVTTDGRYWPSRWRAEQLRQRLASWRASAAS